MSTTTEAPKKGAAGKSVRIDLSGDPRVQLLPPAVRDRAANRSRIRTGVLFVVLGLIVAVGLVAAGSMRAVQAQQALLSANNRTTELLAEQAKYQDAVALDQLVADAKQLQQAATELEIDWGPLLRELVAKLPEGGAVQAVKGLSVAPWEARSTLVGADLTPTDGQTGESLLVVATLGVTLSTVTVQDATNFSRGLAGLKGFLGASISNVAVGTDGLVTSTLVLLLGVDATSGRFVASGDGATDSPSEPSEPAGNESKG